MSNNIEKFIKDHRKEFDNEQPDDNVWEQVEKSIPARKPARSVPMNRVLQWSAAAILLIALAITWILYRNKKNDSDRIVKTETSAGNNSIANPNDVVSIAPEYADEFRLIYADIRSRQQELRAEATDHPSFYQQVEQDLKVLDSSYTALKKQAEQSPNRDVLVKAMIQNLQLRAELLNRQLSIIKEIKHKKTETNEAKL